MACPKAEVDPLFVSLRIIRTGNGAVPREPFGHEPRPIGGGVIDENNFVGQASLRTNAMELLGEMWFAIESSDSNGQFHGIADG